MRILRWAATLASVAALAACDSHFLDPDLAGVWGGENIELTIESSTISLKFICETKGRFPGDVRLDENSAFYRDGEIVRHGGSLDKVRLGASLSHPDTMRAVVYHPGNPLEDPAVWTLVRGQPGTFNSLILCAD